MSSVSAVRNSLNDSNREFIICDSCHWCATLFVDSMSRNTLNNYTFHLLFDACPQCKKNHTISSMPLQRNESYTFLFGDKRDLDIQFRRLDCQSKHGCIENFTSSDYQNSAFSWFFYLHPWIEYTHFLIKTVLVLVLPLVLLRP